MSSRRRTSPALGPLDDEDLLAEILLRLPPNPSSLPRASLVSKRWRSIATDAAFRRRFGIHHRKPPILGVFEERGRILKFMPLLNPPDCIPAERFSLDLSADEFFTWRVLGCRHGRVLLINRWAHVLLTFEPVAEMSSRRRTSPALGPLDDEDLLAEILLRLPPNPSSLPRASLVSKRWRSIATDAAFRRRFGIHHRKPPILGVFEERGRILKFMPLLNPPDCIPAERFSLDLSADEFFTWRVLGCRHGRVLLINRWAHVLLTFEPVSGDTLRILIPPMFVRDGFNSASAAVLCAAGDDQDHVHGDCHYSPFKVVLVTPGSQEEPAIARVYSRETGMWMWGDLISTAKPCAGYVSPRHCTRVGNALYWYLYGIMYTAEKDSILKFDLDNQILTMISRPPASRVDSQIQIIQAEDGGLGLAVLSGPSFQLWDCMVDCHGVATWVPRKTVNMDQILDRKADDAALVGYAEDADAILMSMDDGQVFIIVQLESMKVKECPVRLYKTAYHPTYYPFTNFYTAGTARA